MFFFLNAEREQRNTPATPFVASRPGLTGPNVTRVLASDLDQLRTFLINRYDYDPGEYEGYDNETGSTKFLARLDYNINDKHTVSLRYNQLLSNTDVLASQSGSFSGRRSNQFALNFQNSNYVINNDIYSLIGEVNSRISNNLSNNIIVGFTANRDYRSSRGGIFPLVDILEGGRNYTTFGYEPFTPNNRLDTDTYQFQNNLTYFKGKNTITAGISFEAFEFRNTFTPQYYGQYVFNSLQDFYDAADGQDVTLRRFIQTYSALPGGALPTAVTRANSLGLYIQDEMQVNRQLKVTAGLRLDAPSIGNTALENQEVLTLNFIDPRTEQPLQVNTGQLPGTQWLFSPRVGFNWDVTGDKRTQIRGGSGIFSGRPAFVWISNQIGNNGILTGQIFEDNTNAFPFSPDVNRHIPANPTTPANYNIAVTDPNFRYPQVWRTNLAVDQQLPLGFIGTLEGIYSYNVNDMIYYNINQTLPQGKLDGVDTRPIYGFNNAGNRINPQITNAILLSNIVGGYAYTLTAKVERVFDNGLFFMAAYNFGEAKDFSTSSSIANSSYTGNQTVNGNNFPELSFSTNDQRHRLISSLSYRKDYSEAFGHQFSFFFESRNQNRYSYVINGDINGDQIFNNDLVFVPNRASDLRFEEFTAGGQTFTVAQQQAAFDRFIDNDPYLSKNRGRYVERNGALLPWVTSLDFSYMQEYSVKIKDKKNVLQVRFDVFNFTNLISSNWGVGWRATNNAPLQYMRRDADNVPVFRMSPSKDHLNTIALPVLPTLVTYGKHK